MVVRVIGIGNPLRGDDGVGPAVVEALRRGGLPEGVEAVDAGQAGLGLVGLMEDADRVVLVDASEMGAEAGAVRAFGLGEALMAEEGLGSGVHEARVGLALRMAEALGCLPPEVKVVGVQPKQMGLGVGLSSEVSQALPRAVRAVLEVLGASCGSCIREE